jgi:DNA-binding MarR family transcriptional regulator
MNRNALHELEILKHVEQSPRLNNRLAARKLGASVKLAHATLTKMVEKGLLHVKKEHTRRWDYFLTPRGIAEKTRLTYEFMEFSFQFYREARRRSAQLCRDLSERGVRQVAFIGAGELAEIIYLGVVEWGLELTDVFDDERQGQKFMGVMVRPVEDLGPETGDGGPETGDRRPQTAEKLIVCVYDKKHPMTANYLPEGVKRDKRMVWVF